MCVIKSTLFFYRNALVSSKIGGEALAKSSNVPFLGKNTNNSGLTTNWSHMHCKKGPVTTTKKKNSYSLTLR